MRFSPSSAHEFIRAASEALSNKEDVFDRVATRMVVNVEESTFMCEIHQKWQYCAASLNAI